MEVLEVMSANPQVLIALLLYYVFNAAVQALPDPLPGGSRGYLFLYGFLHALAGNLALVRKQLKTNGHIAG